MRQARSRHSGQPVQIAWRCANTPGAAGRGCAARGDVVGSDGAKITAGAAAASATCAVLIAMVFSMPIATADGVISMPIMRLIG